MKYLFPIGIVVAIIALIKGKYKIAVIIGGLLLVYYIAVSIILARAFG